MPPPREPPPPRGLGPGRGRPPGAAPPAPAGTARASLGGAPMGAVVPGTPMAAPPGVVIFPPPRPWIPTRRGALGPTDPPAMGVPPIGPLHGCPPSPHGCPRPHTSPSVGAPPPPMGALGLTAPLLGCPPLPHRTPPMGAPHTYGCPRTHTPPSAGALGPHRTTHGCPPPTGAPPTHGARPRAHAAPGRRRGGCGGGGAGGGRGRGGGTPGCPPAPLADAACGWTGPPLTGPSAPRHPEVPPP